MRLGELVLAHDAPGTDPQQHVHAVARPLRDLGWVDAAIQPRGEAGVPEVVELTRCGKRHSRKRVAR